MELIKKLNRIFLIKMSIPMPETYLTHIPYLFQLPDGRLGTSGIGIKIWYSNMTPLADEKGFEVDENPRHEEREKDVRAELDEKNWSC